MSRYKMKHISAMNPKDWDQVRSIYLEGIRTDHSTFEADAPEWEKWDSAHMPEHRLVVRSRDRILTWSALSTVSSRQVYSGIAGVSLYVSPGHRGEGIGSVLLKALIESSEKAGIWTLQGSIFPENTSSLIEGTERTVSEGTELVSQTEVAFLQVSEKAKKVAALIDEVASSSNHQSEGIEQITKNLSGLTEIMEARG